MVAVQNLRDSPRRTLDEEIHVKLKAKKSGGSRAICAFGAEDRSRQQRAVMAALPFADLNPHQYLFRGGRNAAIEAIKMALNERGPNGQYRLRWFASLDVRSMYDSIRAESLPELLKGVLPYHEIRHTLTNLERENDITVSSRLPFSDHTIFPRNKGIPAGVDGDSPARAAVEGLPQGSACSPLIAEIVIARLLSNVTFPEGTRVFIYADNFLILGVSEEGIQRTKVTLCGALRAREPAVSLSLRVEESGPVREGLRWLGYRLERRRCRLELRPAPEKIFKLRCDLLWALARITSGHESPELLTLMARGFVAGFDACDARLIVLGELAALQERFGDHDGVTEAIQEAARRVCNPLHRKSRKPRSM
jgi:hypothetical protein